ncbi:carbamoyl-phosphate synthase large subunit [Caldiplasma sukawensis]
MRILVIGSGPVVIGQAAEFDYSGTQACREFLKNGNLVFLLNSNPASYQTDAENATRVYLEEINVENAIKIINKEKIDGVAAAFGGQTALNILLSLHRLGILKEKGIKVLGTAPEDVLNAEDRSRFHKLMKLNGIKITDSEIITREDFFSGKLPTIYPFICRTSFTLGGSSGKIIETPDDARGYFLHLFEDENIDSVEIERSIYGLKEMEYEIIRDSIGNCMMVCNMENVDPVGIHTGESIVVTPSITVNDDVHQKMRETALRIASILNIIGACNVQFAIEKNANDFYVIEVNPRTSRSSALASKATGYPIARISAQIQMGKILPEIRNPINESTSASLEPVQDYVTVKIPRWEVEKFPDDIEIGVAMKSIGESMGIGLNFEEAFFKALASLDLTYISKVFSETNKEIIRDNVKRQTALRYIYILSALYQGMDPDEVSNLSMWEDVFIRKLGRVMKKLRKFKKEGDLKSFIKVKTEGVPDQIISDITGFSLEELHRMRHENSIFPVVRRIDSTSAEYISETNYLFSTYLKNEGEKVNKKPVLIAGSGPNRIGQGLEFDYCSVKAAKWLENNGMGVGMINCNPETVSTDFDTSDLLFFDPVNLEYVENAYLKTEASGLIVQFSGQSGQKIARDMKDNTEMKIIGTDRKSIDLCENRRLFSDYLEKNKIEQPESFREIGDPFLLKFPLIVRGSYIIGGSGIWVARNQIEFQEIAENIKMDSLEITRFVENGTEMDVDFISNGEDFSICGIMIHVEKAGVHSGDAISYWCPGEISNHVIKGIEEIIAKILKGIRIVGIANLQLIEKQGKLFVIELNARASRTVPVIAKGSSIDIVSIAMDAIFNKKVQKIKWNEKCYAKVPVFPYKRIKSVKLKKGPEMHSTGEIIIIENSRSDLMERINHYV